MCMVAVEGEISKVIPYVKIRRYAQEPPDFIPHRRQSTCCIVGVERQEIERWLKDIMGGHHNTRIKLGLLTHAFIQNMLIEHLWCLRHCPRSWGYSDDQDGQSACPMELIFLRGSWALNNKTNCDFRWWWAPQRTRKQRKGTEMGGQGLFQFVDREVL